MIALNQKQLSKITSLALVSITIVLFWPVRHFDFINYDDYDYITQNHYVREGLTWEGIRWAFSHVHSSNWHPLTWISHMIDVQFFGLDPGSHHLINVFFHALNVVLLFLLLKKLTGMLWRSAVVAAVFGWHPMHIQSVAWVAERKDVLSTAFALITFHCYARYVEAKRSKAPSATKYYALTLFAFVLGLLCKPMLITLPLLLLILDFWPLHRFNEASATSQKPPLNNARSLLIEKLPFVAPSAMSVVMTLIAQQGAMGTLTEYPIVARLQNVPLSICTYLGKTFWPADLAIYYPFPQSFDGAVVTSSTLLLLIVTFGAWWWRNRLPYILTGWLWFIVGLVPVLGIVQVGGQAMADRYSYLPMVGIAIAVVWAVAPYAPRIVAVGLCTAISACMIVDTRHELQFWKNDLTVFAHAAEVTDENLVAYDRVTNDLLLSEQPTAAAQIYQQALAIYPKNPDLHNNYGQLLARLKAFDGATNEFATALRLKPNFAKAYSNWGAVLATMGKKQEGQDLLNKALTLDPEDSDAHLNMANLLASEGKIEGALDHYHEASRLAPETARPQYFAAKLLMKARPHEAVAQYREVVFRRPDWPQPMAELAWLLATHSDPSVRNGPEAVKVASEAVALSPHDAKVLGVLDAAYAECGRFDDAIAAATKTAQAASAANQPDLAAAANYRLNLYRQGKPFHQP